MAVAPRGSPARRPTLSPKNLVQHLASPPLPASSFPRLLLVSPCAAAAQAPLFRRPPWPAFRVASRCWASYRSSRENYPCLERDLPDCWPVPSSSCSSPSWLRGTRPYVSLPSLVNSNPPFSNIFACLPPNANILCRRLGSAPSWVIGGPKSMRSPPYKFLLTGGRGLGKVRALRLPKRALFPTSREDLNGAIFPRGRPGGLPGSWGGADHRYRDARDLI